MSRPWLLMVLLLSALSARADEYPAPGPGFDALWIAGTTDEWAMAPLIEAFQAVQPGTAVSYDERTTLELYHRVRAAADAGQPVPDVVISSAADLQVKLANDGYALPYPRLAEDWLPAWARWRDRVFGFSFEPVVIAYDPRVLTAEAVPRTRFDLLAMLRADPARFRGRVGTYDIEESGVGYLMASQDSLRASTYGRLIEAFGRAQVELVCCTGDLLDGIESGELVVAYNVLGSYAAARVAGGAPLAIVAPGDYTLVLTRVAMIPRTAGNVPAARRFLDFLFSRDGQALLTTRAGIPALHPDVDLPGSGVDWQRRAQGPLRPVQLGPGLLVFLDRQKQSRMLGEWRASVRPVRAGYPP